MAEELKTIQTVDLSPFKCMVMTIGELPSSFVESMTYYEALAWLDNYLEKTLIPAVNNNAEAVQELQDLYIELHDYVKNYFDNLDVQEEINNKLDQMAEDGQLTQLIAQFLSLNAVMSFQSVADMKLAENLVNGSTVETYGFYSVNDGGGAKYLVRTITNDDTIDEKTIIELYDDYLIAELIKEDEMSVKQFGAKGDGTTDDTLSIQTALNYCNNIIVPSGTFMVNAITHILPNSNNRIKLDNDAIIEAIGNSATNYAVIDINNKSNVEISGGTIKGDRTTHSGDTGEWGMCLSIENGASNIYIHDIKLINAWGDGLYINNATNVKTQNLIIDNARRNGISIISVETFNSLNDYISNTNGTAPQAGVDIEPNYTTDKLIDINFNNLTTYNNTGSGFAIVALKDVTNAISITNTNFHDDGSTDGISIAKNSGTKGLITIDSPFCENNKQRGISMGRCYDSNCKVKIVKPYILNSNTSEGTAEAYATPIVAYIDSGHTQGTLGNIEIIEPFISTTYTVPNYIVFRNDNYNTTKSNNIKIIDPTNLISGKFIVVAQPATNVTFTDKYNVTAYIFNSSTNALATRLHSLYAINEAANSEKTLTLQNTYEIGRILKFRHDSLVNNGKLSIQMYSGNYCKQLSPNAGVKITLNNFGDCIEIQRVTDTEWRLISSNCEPTIS